MGHATEAGEQKTLTPTVWSSDNVTCPDRELAEVVIKAREGEIPMRTEWLAEAGQ